MFKITQFQTIARHQSKLSQSPSTITCLVNVLNYIKEVLDSDQTVTLFQMIQHHIETVGDTAHHINLALLNAQVVSTLYHQFKSSGIYTGPEEGFVEWLLSNPIICDTEMPSDLDSFSRALTLRLAIEVFSETHDKVLTAHSNNLSTYLDKLMLVGVAPIYTVVPEMFEISEYNLVGDGNYEKLMLLVANRLSIITLTDPIVDYTSYPDTLTLRRLTATEEELAIASIYLEDIYAENTVGSIMYQFNSDMLYAILTIGADRVLDYLNMLTDCGETDGRYIHRKEIDYYSNHLDYVVSHSMDMDYQALLTELRSSVNRSYSKVYYIQTLLNKTNSTLCVTGSIHKFTHTKTIDLVNIVGLRRSILAISLIPYDEMGIIYNKIVIAFDNYNPSYTEVLVDKISHPMTFHIATSMRLGTVVTYVTVDDMEHRVEFDTEGMANVDPYFLFVIPRVAYPKENTIRLQKVSLHGVAFDDEHTESAVAGFRQQF